MGITKDHISKAFDEIEAIMHYSEHYSAHDEHPLTWDQAVNLGRYIVEKERLEVLRRGLVVSKTGDCPTGLEAIAHRIS